MFNPKLPSSIARHSNGARGVVRIPLLFPIMSLSLKKKKKTLSTLFSLLKLLALLESFFVCYVRE